MAVLPVEDLVAAVLPEGALGAVSPAAAVILAAFPAGEGAFPAAVFILRRRPGRTIPLYFSAGQAMADFGARPLPEGLAERLTAAEIMGVEQRLFYWL